MRPPQVTLPSATGGLLPLLAGISPAISLTPLLYRLDTEGLAVLNRDQLKPQFLLPEKATRDLTE